MKRLECYSLGLLITGLTIPAPGQEREEPAPSVFHREACLVVPTHRHHEDPRRYNAAPCYDRFDTLVYRGRTGSGLSYTETTTPVPVYLVSSREVSRIRRETTRYDEKGRRTSQQVFVVTYKDKYSDGSCRIWQETVY